MELFPIIIVINISDVNYQRTKDSLASLAESLMQFISPQALISVVPTVLFLQNANFFILFAASNIKRFAFHNIYTAGTAGIKACGDMSVVTHSAQEAHKSSVRG